MDEIIRQGSKAEYKRSETGEYIYLRLSNVRIDTELMKYIARQKIHTLWFFNIRYDINDINLLNNTMIDKFFINGINSKALSIVIKFNNLHKLVLYNYNIDLEFIRNFLVNSNKSIQHIVLNNITSCISPRVKILKYGNFWNLYRYYYKEANMPPNGSFDNMKVMGEFSYYDEDLIHLRELLETCDIKLLEVGECEIPGSHNNYDKYMMRISEMLDALFIPNLRNIIESYL